MRNQIAPHILKSLCTALVFTWLSARLMAQAPDIDVSSLPKAIYTETYGFVDRWSGIAGNIIAVDMRLDAEGKVTFSNSLIETTQKKDRPAWIIFPEGGSETDIIIYRLERYSAKGYDFERTALKSKVFMWGADIAKMAIPIDDLKPGYYLVDYVSCHYSGGYVLHILEQKEP